MTDAIAAAYADWKLVRGRKVCQIVLEIPIEQANLALDALGGMPRPDAEVWVAVARLKAPPDQQAESNKPKPLGSWRGLAPAQQAGILCNETPFWRFLSEGRNVPVSNVEAAITVVRQHCGVSSRAELSHDAAARRLWESLVAEYRAWQKAPSAGVA